MINTKLVYISLSLSAIILVCAAIYPALDIRFSLMFYDNVQGFIYRDNILVRFIYLIIPFSTKLFGTVCILYLLYKLIVYKNWRAVLLSKVFYLVITAIIGPGLLVNTVLKDHWGRARPVQITDFGGEKSFSNPLMITYQCQKNCSFSCGHAAMAYYYTSLAYVLGRRNKNYSFSSLYILGIIFGTVVGLVRIVMGGHFLSDVAASCFVILLTNHLTYLYRQKYANKEKFK